MSIFGDIDIANAEEVSNVLPADTYECVVSNFEVKPTKDGSKLGLNIAYTVSQEGRFKARLIFEWQRVPRPTDTDLDEAGKAQALSYLKHRLLSLGIPEDRLNTVQPADVIGKTVLVSVKVKPRGGEDQNQVTKVQVPDDNYVRSTGGHTGFGGQF